jgi:3D (Asp-Asp-Asp) domain-containing protein
MHPEQIHGELKTRYRLKRYESLKRSTNRYFLAVCVLFLALALMCANNVAVYNSYMEVKSDFDAATQSVKAVLSESENLNSDKDKLKAENETIKKDYDKVMKQNQQIAEQLRQIKAVNDELTMKNRELANDNIELQNTLKMAAEVGIKPQNYTKFNGISSRGSVDRGRYIGKFLGTAYTPSKEECGNDKGITNSGEPIIPGISIAIDNQYWPFGTVFYIKGLGYAIAMDTGSAIKGKYRFDFSVFDKKFAKALGSRKWDVYLVKLGDGSADKITF